MANILDTIIAHKKTEVAALNAQALRRAAEQSPAPRDFLAAIRRRDMLPVSLIAELKRASPSKGILAPHLDLFQVADIYMDNGASAISVLTDEKFFKGKLETLHALRTSHAARVPLLRKDFIIDESQLYEARANGADAVLLIAAALTDDTHFAALHECAISLGLTILVEVHNENELERALKIPNIKLVGINNRDLATFDISLATTERLRPLIPPEITMVSESGIFTAEDVARLEKVGIDAILVGEALITAPDIAKKVREMAATHAP
jgi:indole-3-glycerol phosphate synthase